MARVKVDCIESIGCGARQKVSGGGVEFCVGACCGLKHDLDLVQMGNLIRNYWWQQWMYRKWRMMNNSKYKAATPASLATAI